ASAIFHISRLNPAPRMAPVYTSNPALPRRPQDSVPACPLRLWPDETFTHRHSSAWHDVPPGGGVGARGGSRSPAGSGRLCHAARAGSLTKGSSLKGAMVSCSGRVARPTHRFVRGGWHRRAE